MKWKQLTLFTCLLVLLLPNVLKLQLAFSQTPPYNPTLVTAYSGTDFKISATNTTFTVCNTQTFYTITSNPSNIWLNQTYSFMHHAGFEIYVSGTNNTQWLLYSFFQTANGTAQLKLTSPTSTDVVLVVYSPNFISASVTGAVSYTFASETLTITVNTNTNGGVIVISATYNETLVDKWSPEVASGNFLNPDDRTATGLWIYAEQKYYMFQITFWDGDGYQDINYGQIKFSDGAGITVEVQYTQATNTFTLLSGNSIAKIIQGNMTVANVYEITVTFYVWIFGTVTNANNILLSAYVQDNEGLSSGWKGVFYFNINKYGAMGIVSQTAFSAAFAYEMGEYCNDTQNGAVLLDCSNNKNYGTSSGINAPYMVLGKYGYGLAFDGQHTWIKVADSSTTEIQKMFSVGVWVYPCLTNTTQGIIFKNGEYGLYIDNFGYPVWEIYAGSWYVLKSTVAINALQWSYITGVFDINFIVIYVNAFVAGNMSVSFSPGYVTPTSNYVEIGRMNGADYFCGILDELRGYDQALGVSAVTSIEISQITVPTNLLQTTSGTGTYGFYNNYFETPWVISGTTASESLVSYNFGVPLGWIAVGSGYQYIAEDFQNINNAVYLTTVSFYIKKVGNPAIGNCYAYLYSVSGAYGSGSEVPGSVLAVSNPVSDVLLSSSGSWINFTFDLTNTYLMQANVAYFVGGDTDIAFDPSNYIAFCYTANNTQGIAFVHSSTMPYWLPDNDFAYNVYGRILTSTGASTEIAKSYATGFQKFATTLLVWANVSNSASYFSWSFNFYHLGTLQNSYEFYLIPFFGASSSTWRNWQLKWLMNGVIQKIVTITLVSGATAQHFKFELDAWNDPSGQFGVRFYEYPPYNESNADGGANYYEYYFNRTDVNGYQKQLSYFDPVVFCSQTLYVVNGTLSILKHYSYPWVQTLLVVVAGAALIAASFIFPPTLITIPAFGIFGLASVTTTSSTLLLLGGFGLVAGGIIPALGAIINVAQAIGAVFAPIVGPIVSAISWLGTQFSNLLTPLATLIWIAFSSAMSPIFNAICSVLVVVWGNFVALGDLIFSFFGWHNGFTQILAFLATFFGWITNSVNILIQVLTSVFNVLTNAVLAGANLFVSFFSSLTVIWNDLVWIWNSALPYWWWVPQLITEIWPLLLFLFALWLISPMFEKRSIQLGLEATKSRIELTVGLMWKFGMFAWKIIDFVISTISRIIEAVPVVE